MTEAKETHARGWLFADEVAWRIPPAGRRAGVLLCAGVLIPEPEMRVDVRHLRFRKEDGRNRDDLTVVSGLFDRNGNYVIGNQKRIEMRLRDETLDHRLGSGIALRTSFDVKPGSYMIRLVVRDDEGQLMAAENGAVEIP